nr:type I DNA topoisomerase [Candidatus Mycoplasma haematolamae]
MFIESSSKIKSIGKYLGDKDIKLFATYGHIRDLKKGWIGFGPNNLKIEWETTNKKIDYLGKKVSIVEAIKKEAREATRIYFSTDPDREGEAISWHIFSILNKEDQKKCLRATFNEITERAIKAALENPRELDQDQVNSYLARRLLDRWIGFKLSHYTQKKVGGLSAGRVQSIALKFLVDREDEIASFQKKSWYILRVKLENELLLSLIKLPRELEGKVKLADEDKKGIIHFAEKKELVGLLAKLDDLYLLESISDPVQESFNPPEVLKTSTMYELAINKLGLKSAIVERTAQKLYEGITLGTEVTPLITYPRTDRAALSEEFIVEAKKYIVDKFSEEYLSKTDKSEESKKVVKKKDILVQGAHEGIRPVDLTLTPASLSKFISTGTAEYKLYNLIWSYTLASLMSKAKNEKKRYQFSNQQFIFNVTETYEIFDGFKKILRNSGLMDKPEKPHTAFKTLKVGNKYKKLEEIISEESNSPPPKYTEASLIKALEHKGIGRPSTYPEISKTVLKRNYAEFKNKKFEITKLGYKVSKDLDKNFASFISYDYTRLMEEELDNISKSKTDWKKFLGEVFVSWDDSFSKAEKYEIVPDQVCPDCGKELAFKFSKKGYRFVGCTAFPTCKYRSKAPKEDAEEPETLEKLCPQCNSNLVKRKNRWDNYFIACPNFPKCKYIEKEEEVIELVENTFCPKCNAQMIYKESRKKPGKKFAACPNYPKCRPDFVRKGGKKKSEGKLLDRRCPDCSSPLAEKTGKRGSVFVGCSSYPKCKYIEKKEKPS